MKKKIEDYLQFYGKVPRNTLILYLTHIAASLLSIFFFGILARYLGVLNFGIFSYAYAFMTIAQTIGAFGLDMFMIREISSDTSNAIDIVGNIFTLKILFSFITLFFTFIVILFSNVDPITKKSLLVFSPYIIFSNLSLTLWYVGDGYQKMEYRGTFTIIYYFLRTIGGWAVLKYTRDIIALFIVLIMIEFIVLIFSFLITNSYFGRIKLVIKKNILKRISCSSFPFAISSILSIFLLRLDILLLNVMKGENTVGLYSPAQKLVSMILLFSSAFTFAIYPAMSNISKNTMGKDYYLFIHSAKIMFLIGLFAAFFITIIAGPVIKIIFGSEYTVSARVLKILVWMCPPFFCASTIWVLFAVKNFQHWTTIVYLIGLPVNLGLNFYLIKKMSYFGSALAMVLFSFFILIISFIIYYGNRKKLFNMW
ncbi:MAG TPA: flippase [bacterium]|mgnify:FL=1|nr:flippase [bacterium]HPP30075.1 flippase [bacterium]